MLRDAMVGNPAFVAFAISLILVAPRAANAQAQASAKGSVTIAVIGCDFATVTCSSGGSGARVSFSFTGVPDEFGVAQATGDFTAYFPDIGLRATFLTGIALIIPSAHTLVLTGTCQTESSTGGVVSMGAGSCQIRAEDNTPNGATDRLQMFVTTPTGQLIAVRDEPASGNININ